MTTPLIIFISFASLLFLALSGATGMYLMGEKGRSTIKGFFIGLIPFLGPLAIAIFVKPSDETIVNEMYDRDMMNLDEVEKTVEFKIKK